MLALGCDKRRETVLECRSPGGVYTATFYVEMGGGAAGWGYEYVSVRRNDSGAERVILKTKGAQDLLLRWSSDRRLEITYPETARVDRWESVFDWRAFDEKGALPKSSLREERADENGRFLHAKPGCGG